MKLVAWMAGFAMVTIGCAARPPVQGPPVTDGRQRQPAAPPSAPASPVPVAAAAAASGRLTATDLDARMRTIGPTFGTMRTRLTGNQLADAERDAQTLANTFTDVERFFQQYSKGDAVQWAQQARTGAYTVAAAAAGGDAMKAQAAAGALQNVCAECHRAYREGDAQTGYRIRAGALPAGS